MLQYEIEHEGKKYFANVILKEIYPFEYGGKGPGSFTLLKFRDCFRKVKGTRGR